MATFMEPKFPISKDQRKQPPRNNATLEDVAEEILNGILCQYEPPNQERLEFRKRYPSILRRPKNQRTTNNGKSKTMSKPRVRWMDERVEDDEATSSNAKMGNAPPPPPMNENRGWSVAEACFDAGVEVGCVSTSSRPWNEDLDTKKQMMNAKEAIAVARAKSPRNHIKEEIVFDDEGNPTYLNSGPVDPASPKIALPSAPPPPSRKERFFPELCGVRINCGEEEAYFHVMSRSSDALRCGRDDDENMEDDFDNSLIDYNDDSDSGSDAGKHSNRHELQPKERADRKTMREIIDNYLEQEEEGDDADWEGAASPTSSSTNLLRRMWPRKDAAKVTKAERESDSDDERRSPKQSTEKRRTVSRSRSPGRRDPAKTSAKAVAIHDVYESVEMVHPTSPKANKKAGLGAKLKSMVVSKSPRSLKKVMSSSSSASLHGEGYGDWDDSLPIVPGLSSAERDSAPNERPPPTKNVASNLQVPPHPSRLPPPVQQFSAKNPVVYPHMHPAHPLVNQPQVQERDDRLERQSFITAHRHVYDNSKQATAMNDDAVERQSFIGAYRNGIEGKPASHPPARNTPEKLAPIMEHPPTTAPPSLLPPHYPHAAYGPRAHDDAFERQSFISAHRQGFDGRLPPTSGGLSHDDIMERMSYITAYRQGIDPMTLYNNDSGIKSFPPYSKQKPRSRSRSPYRRNRSYDSINEGNEYQRVPQPTPAMYTPAMTRDPQAITVYPPHSNYYSMPQYNPYPPYASYGPIPQQAAPVVGDNREGNENVQSTVQMPPVHEQNASTELTEQHGEPEMTWEERTRQAWERIRGGISALTFEATSDENVKEDNNKNNTNESTDAVDSMNPVAFQQPNQIEANNVVQPPYPYLLPQPSELQQPHDLTKRVSFGEPQQMIYYDDQDENRSTMSLPTRTTKKKMKFRGAKLVGGVLGKVKNSLTKVSSLSRSLSSDTHGTMNSGKSSYSTEWEGPVYYPHYSPQSAHGPLPYGQNYQVKAMYQGMEGTTQNEPQLQSYHRNFEVPQQVQQYNYPHPMQSTSQNHVQPPPLYSRQVGNGYPFQNSKIYNYPVQQQYSGPLRDSNSRRSL